MGVLDGLQLQTMAEVQAERARTPNPKPVPHQITKNAKKKQKKLDDDSFRAEIWRLDEGKSRATGKPLVKSGTTDWHKLGEVDHAMPRSTSPDRVYDLSNGVLLSKWENRMRKVACIRAPEFQYFNYTGSENRREPQTFIWRNDDGAIVRETVG